MKTSRLGQSAGALVKRRRCLIALSGTILAAVLTSCSMVGLEGTSADSSLVDASTVEDVEPFRDAVATATNAADLTQIAETPDDWHHIARLWQNAINLMKAVPVSHARYDVAQQRAFDEYPKNLDYAQSKAGDSAVLDFTLDDDKLTQVDFGESWPFTVDGEVECERINTGTYDVMLVTLRSIDQIYAVNSQALARAAERGWRDLAEIWRNEDTGTAKVPLQWVVMRGEAQCLEAPAN